MENNIFVYRNNFGSYPIVVPIPIRQQHGVLKWPAVFVFVCVYSSEIHIQRLTLLYTHTHILHTRARGLICWRIMFVALFQIFFFYSSAIATPFPPGQTFTHVYIIIIMCARDFFSFNCCRQLSIVLVYLYDFFSR